MLNEKVIVSPSNPVYKDLLSLKKNEKDLGLVLIQGEDLLQLAIQNGKLKDVILLKEDFAYSDFREIILSESLYKNLASFQSLPKVMGVARMELGKELLGDKIVYLDGIQDPGNLGTIARTALAFGYRSLVLSQDCVSPFNAKAVSASKGSFFGLNIVYRSLEEVKKAGYKLAMTDLNGKDISQVKKPEGKFAVVIGNEGQGIRPNNLALADVRVLLPIDRSIDSLNAAVAAGIFLFLWR